MQNESIGKRSKYLLSVIIANFNYGRFLEEAIQSVLSQGMEGEVEIIICDAASSDNSVGIIKRYAKGLPPNTEYDDWCNTNFKPPELCSQLITWWCSEKDGGQSAAFNKGFSHAKGRFLTWLNADDILLPGTVKTLQEEARRHPDCEWFTGNYLQFRQDNGIIIFAPWGPHVLPRFLQSFNSPLVVFGPTSFWSRRSYMIVGPIDETLHYSMDTDYWLRMRKHGYMQRRLNHCCWAFRMHDSSKTAQYGERKIDEAVRNRWYEELNLVDAKVGYRCSTFRRFIGYFMRIVDGSALVAFCRRLFVVGRHLEIYRSVKHG